MPALRKLRSWCLIAALGAAIAVFGGVADEAAAAAGTGASAKTSGSKTSGSTKKSSSAKKKKKTSSTKKKKSPPPTTKPAAAKPQLRPADAPGSVAGDDESESESEDADVDAGADEPTTPDDDLAAIEAELLAEIAAGRLPPGPAVEEEAAPPPPPVDTTPRWVEHEVIPYETVEAVAARYGVSVKEIIKWNKLDAKKPRLRSGRSIKLKVAAPPPPRERIDYEIQKGDGWEKIAEAHGVEVKLLKKWNPAKKGKDGKAKSRMIAGKSLRIWVEPVLLGVSEGGAPSPAAEGRLLAAKVRSNAFSIGAPTRGRLVNGVAFPDNPEHYTLRKPEQAYGSSHTVRTAVQAIASFRRGSKYGRELVIGAVSLARGGRFRPHKSHQSGRDIDIRLPIKAGVGHHNAPSFAEIDWRATWKLIEAFVATGEVQYIFLEYRLQKTLYKAARAAGVPAKELAAVIQWPRPAKSNNGIVRHAKGHSSHIHVRVKCGPAESKCEAGR